MRLLLTSTALATILISTAVYAGGDDGFGGSETSKHSDYGGPGSMGEPSRSSISSSHQGFGGHTVSSLSSEDRIEGFDHQIDTYLVNDYYKTRTLVNSRTDPDPHYSEEGMANSWSRMAEQRRREQEAEDARKAAAARKPTPAPVAAPPAAPPAEPAAPAPVDMGPINAPPIEVTWSPPAPPAAIVDLGTISPPLAEIKPREARRKQRAYEKIDEAVDAINEARRDGVITSKERKTITAVVNAAYGAGAGAITGKRGFPGRAGAIVGAMIGGSAAEVKRQLTGKTLIDDLVRDLTTTGKSEMELARERARHAPPEEQQRIIREAREKVAEKRERDRRDRQRERHEGRSRGVGNMRGGDN